MKTLNDEEIQRLLEAGLDPAEELIAADEKKDLEHYRFLFEKLKEEPKEGLSYSFASRLSSHLQMQFNRKKDVKFYLVAFAVLNLGFGMFYGLLLLVDASAGPHFMAILFEFKWVIILGAMLLISILYLDQRLVKDRA